MKIALLNWSIGKIKGDIYGGVENVMVDIKYGLMQKGHQVKLYANTIGANKEFSHIHYYRNIPHLDAFLYFSRFLFKSRYADIRQFHNCPVGVLFSPKNSIAFFHNELHLAYHRLFWKRYNLSNFVFVSEYLKNKTLSTFPKINPKRCLVIHNAVDTEVFYPLKNNKKKKLPVVSFVGQWNKKKGLPVLLNAVRILQKNKVMFELNLIGGLDLWPSVNKESVITQADLDKILIGLSNVKLIGKLNRADLVRELQNSSIAVVPSVWQEPFGLTVVEAMASRLPVVATKVGGLPEIVIDNECGLLVEPDNPEQLAMALLKLIKDPDMRERMGSSARARAVKYFSKEGWLQKVIALHREILNDF